MRLGDMSLDTIGDSGSVGESLRATEVLVRPRPTGFGRREFLDPGVEFVVLSLSPRPTGDDWG